ncbi:UDP-glucose 4-epimerase [Halarchaeum grantii]|uniref:UDP-glucose 4-epimerase n=1 Tax=Halarchaeum grantii TaxID=1193105 RepID=A0A830FAR3_9EURY|nr:NAD(P)-dependent oxidoreductase [Halarchaeum grantii]GGL36215.1 UDP-glucose 4-epimerase [Halarchaeum grantii]
MSLEEERVLVTGGTGFIGSYVTRQLLNEGSIVHALDNGFTGDESLVPDDVTVHQADIRELDEVVDVVEEVSPDVLIHLAAIHFIPYCNENPEDAFDVNVMGTRNVLEAARGLDGLKRVVNTSSAAVYAPDPGPHVETEGIGPMDIYGRTKLVAEDEARLFNADTGVPTASARLFNVYGTRETNSHLIPAILEQLEGGSRSVDLGNLSPARDFIYASDIASALITLASEFNGEYRAYNVGTGTEHSVREVVEAVRDALGEEITIEQDEERVRESDRPHLKADITRLTGEFDWEPTYELREGLAKVLAEEDI